MISSCLRYSSWPSAQASWMSHLCLNFMARWSNRSSLEHNIYIYMYILKVLQYKLPRVITNAKIGVIAISCDVIVLQRQYHKPKKH